MSLREEVQRRILHAPTGLRKKESELRDELDKARKDSDYVEVLAPKKKVQSDQRGILGVHLESDWLAHLLGNLLGSAVKFGFTARRDFLVGAWAVEGKPYHVEKGTVLWAEIGESFNQLRIGGCDVRKLIGDGLVEAPAILRPFLKGKPTDRPAVKIGPANRTGQVSGEWSRDMKGPGDPADQASFNLDAPSTETEGLQGLWDMKELERLDAAWRTAYGMEMVQTEEMKAKTEVAMATDVKAQAEANMMAEHMQRGEGDDFILKKEKPARKKSPKSASKAKPKKTK